MAAADKRPALDPTLDLPPASRDASRLGEVLGFALVLAAIAITGLARFYRGRTSRSHNNR